VLFGEDIARIDCPAEPVELRDGDMLIAASDGLQFLTNEQITALLRSEGHRPSAEVADLILRQIEDLEDPDLDNVSFSIVKLSAKAVRRNSCRDVQTRPVRRVG
jgi:serine/threonine protein phosphatase PrpC